MIQKILLSGLVLLPFYEIILFFFMPSGRLPGFIDGRVTKEYLALGLALSLIIVVWQEVKKITCPNKWALYFLLFLFINLSKTPIGVVNPTIDVSLLGSFSAEFKVFAFFLMFCSLSSCDFSKEFVDKIFKTILWSSVIMAGYMVLQACNLDQIYKPKPEYLKSAVKSLRVVGFFDQPTLATPFLVMSIPFAIYFRNIFAIIILSIASLLTGSDFAIISLAAIWLVYASSYYASSRKKWPLLLWILAILSIVYAKMFLIDDQFLFSDNGRFKVWGMILSDVFSGSINGVDIRIGLFGGGLNNFGKVFTALHQSAYTRAHNEYMQVLWSCGVVGLGIFTMIHYDIFKTAWGARKNPLIKPLIISLTVLIICAQGTFLYQLGFYQFYIVILVALIYQRGYGYVDSI